MANVHVINFQVQVNRVLPIVQIIALKGEKGDPGEGTGEMNVIDTVKVNGTALPVVNKAVNVPVPTDLGDLTNNTGYLKGTDVSGGVSSGNTKLVSGGQVYTAIQNATSTTGGVGSGNTNLVNGGQVYTAIQTAIASIADGDEESY